MVGVEFNIREGSLLELDKVRLFRRELETGIVEADDDARFRPMLFETQVLEEMHD